tara:strand:- start:43 stop:645 length:603 start_codon:yes stop_codon:yes gene_type:complete
MKISKEWNKVGTNPKIKELIGPEAFLVWISNRDNALSLYNMGDVSGRWIEKIVEENEGDSVNESTNQNIKGKDIVRQGVDGEIKTTSTICNFTDDGLKHKSCHLQIGALMSKKGPKGTKKDIIIVDAVNFRRFEIPHDDFYYGDFQLGEVKAATRSGKEDLNFRWYADYDSEKYYLNGDYRSPSKSNNTKLILNYEKKNK